MSKAQEKKWIEVILSIRAVLTAQIFEKRTEATPSEGKAICFHWDQIFGEHYPNKETLVEIIASLVRGAVLRPKFKQISHPEVESGQLAPLLWKREW